MSKTDKFLDALTHSGPGYETTPQLCFMRWGDSAHTEDGGNTIVLCGVDEQGNEAGGMSFTREELSELREAIGLLLDPDTSVDS